MAKYSDRIVSSLRVGEKLKKLREAKGITRPELSAKTGMHKQTIFQLEKFHRDPKLSTLYSYAYGLDITLGQLIQKLESEEL